MEVEVLEFKVPVENNKTLFVWNVESSFSEAQIHDALDGVLSCFGPLYLLKVCPNAALHAPGFYAIAKFYSAAHAAAAQRHTDGRTLFQSTPLKVRLSSKHTPHFLSDSRPLSHARCVELANHYLGFTGWTSDIITLKELTDEEEEEEEGEGGAGATGGARRRTLRFGCQLQLCFPQHGLTGRAAAVVEESFTCTGPGVVLQKRCKLLKKVREEALVQAFSSVLLILLADGEVMVEMKQTSDQLLPEPTEGLLQVQDVSWEQSAPVDAEEDDEDVTLS